MKMRKLFAGIAAAATLLGGILQLYRQLFVSKLLPAVVKGMNIQLICMLQC